MKKYLLVLVASFALCGSIFAQYESHWPDFYYPDYELQAGFVAAIQIDGQIINVTDANWNALEVAAFVDGDECRSNGNYLYDGYITEYGDPYPILNGFPIYYTTTGDNIYFKMYDHLNDIEYTYCQIIYNGAPITVQTGDDHFEGWDDPENPIYLCFFSSSCTQTISLATGINWCSFFVETSLTDVENALIAAFPNITTSQTLQIQSQTHNVKWTRGQWRGELSSLDFAQTYMITVPSECEITIEGMSLNPADYTITLDPGVNWIGYPVNATLTVEEAFISASPVNNDIVQSQVKNSKRTRGQWMGELGTLQPGQGFMYQSEDTGTRSFTFPSNK